MGPKMKSLRGGPSRIASGRPPRLLSPRETIVGQLSDLQWRPGRGFPPSALKSYVSQELWWFSRPNRLLEPIGNLQQGRFTPCPAKKGNPNG
jgi:hypothetical protein